MTYVRYIDRTRVYYAGQGYTKPFDWAHFDEVPFTPLDKPLAECRVATVSTADVYVAGDDGTKPHNAFTGDVYSLPSDTPVARLVSTMEHYDQHATHMDDIDSFLPLTRLAELAAAGPIGGVTARSHGVFTSYSKRKTLTVDGPEILKRCREDGADVALLTPI